MKLQNHQNALATNMDDMESQDFTIGDAGTIIEILRNRLYTKKIGTPVQEIISNGRDACREAGKKDGAFYVVVPTRLNPVFSVRDYGIGLTPERVKNIFIRYGSSTKRTDNTMTGGFGLGSKSFWAYTDSFTVTTYLDGIRRSYVAHVGVNNQGRLDLVSTNKTDEENGTEVSVAVKSGDIDEFRAAIHRATYFWPDKPTFKGELDPPTLVRGKVISDLVEVIDRNVLPEYIRDGSNYYGHSAIAVIDGIPYPMNSALLEKVKTFEKLENMTEKTILLHFGNGVVEVAASRESIADSPHTLASLEKIAQKATLEVQTHITEVFGKVKTTQEYLKTYTDESHYFNVDKFAKFGQYQIESRCIKSPLLKKIKITLVDCMDKRGRHRVERVSRKELTEGHKEIHIEHFNHIFLVQPGQDNKVVQNKRIREYLKATNYMVLIELLNTHTQVLDKTGKAVLDKDGKPTLKSVSYPKEIAEVAKDFGAKDFHALTYINAPKVARTGNAKIQRATNEFCVRVVRGETFEYLTLASNIQKWFYIPLEKNGWPEGYTRQILGEFESYMQSNEDARICGASATALKFIKGNANFIPLADWLAKYKPTANLINRVKRAKTEDFDSLETISKLKDLDDAFLTEMGKEARAMEKSAGLNGIPEVLVLRTMETKEYQEFKSNEEKFTKLIKAEYPLVNEISTWSDCRNELTYYINAKYNRKGK